MAAKKRAKKPQGNYMDDFANAILGAIKAGGKGASKPAPRKLGNLRDVEKSFGGRYKRTAPPSPPKRSGSNQAGPRPVVPMRPVPPSRPVKPAFQERPSVPMRPRPPQPPVKTTKPAAVKTKPTGAKKQAVKPAPKKTQRKRQKGMQK